ncbi:MAG: IS1380 family transposase [Propionicimonas sp.]
MQLSHTPAQLSAVFDDPNLIGCAGLVPVVGLCDQIGLRDLAGEWIKVPGLGRANAGAKVMSLVAGMVAGADCIDDMDVLRHGGMDKVFRGWRAPATLGQFLRSFTFGHVRQFDAVASRALISLAGAVPALIDRDAALVFLDIDDTVKAGYGIHKQGLRVGYTKIKGLNAQLVVASTANSAPVITATRLRHGAASSAHGGVRIITDSITTTRRAGVAAQILVRADSGYYQQANIAAITRTGAWFSIGARQDQAVKAAIASIPKDAWVKIVYPNAIVDPDTGELISEAQVAETTYTAFTSKPKAKQVTARLIVRRVPERNTKKLAAAGQLGLFEVWRYHAIFTDNPAPLVEAEKTHRAHAIVENVIADLKASALAALPCKSHAANGAWLVAAAIAFNITRAIGISAGDRFTKAETATIRAKLIKTPARVSHSGRRQQLHLPTRWPWSTQWLNLWTSVMTT